MTHICVIKLTTIGSDTGLSPRQSQASIWINGGILLIRPSGTHFSEIVIEILIFSFKIMHFIGSFAKWRPLCLSLDMLSVIWQQETMYAPPTKLCSQWNNDGYFCWFLKACNKKPGCNDYSNKHQRWNNKGIFPYETPWFIRTAAVVITWCVAGVNYFIMYRFNSSTCCNLTMTMAYIFHFSFLTNVLGYNFVCH